MTTGSPVAAPDCDIFCDRWEMYVLHIAGNKRDDGMTDDAVATAGVDAVGDTGGQLTKPSIVSALLMPPLPSRCPSLLSFFYNTCSNRSYPVATWTWGHVLHTLIS